MTRAGAGLLRADSRGPRTRGQTLPPLPRYRRIASARLVGRHAEVSPMSRPVNVFALVLLLFICGTVRAGPDAPGPRPLRELDAEPAPPADRLTAIVGAALVDGTGGP